MSWLRESGGAPREAIQAIRCVHFGCGHRSLVVYNYCPRCGAAWVWAHDPAARSCTRRKGDNR